MIAQAEHGSGKEKIYLVFTKENQFEEIISETLGSKELSHRNQYYKSSSKVSLLLMWNIWMKLFVLQMVSLLNIWSCKLGEHFIFAIKYKTAGALLLGHFSAIALGDFVAGPSHALPTGRRIFSGLRIEDFFRRTSIIKYDEESIKNASKSLLFRRWKN